MINLASKFSPKVDERITIKSYTGKSLNKDYKFEGVDKITVYSIDTAPLNFYKRSGLSRYGTPNDLGDTVATYQIKQDIAYTFVIDKGDNTQQMMIKNTSGAIKRETDEVIVPYIDRYRFAIFCEEADAEMTDTTALTKTNVYEKILNATSKLNKLGFGNGLIIYITPETYNLLKLDNNFVRQADMSQKMLRTGLVGEVDGFKVIRVDGSRLPNGVDFLIASERAMISPTQLKDTKVHDNPPGVNGWLVEFRMIMDAFILNSRKKSIFMQGARTSAINFKLNAGYKAVPYGIDVYKDEKVYSKVASASITASTIGSKFDATGYTLSVDADENPNFSKEITGTSTNKYAEVVVVDRNGNVRDAKSVELKA